MSSFTPGTILAQRYEIQQVLGKKTGRRTLLAYDSETDRPVVLKLLRFDSDFEWEHLKLFEREAETLQSLDHPAIPQYLDHFELDAPDCKGFVLVQSYIEARSLEAHIKSGRSFSETELKQLAGDILEILIYLHRQNPPVIHRDIKPSNILLGDRSGNHVGQVYLVDFGSVQTIAAREGGTITIVGTYGYMPPEQFGERAVPASDLYSLGATLIYLATGKHPADLPQRSLRIQFEPIATHLDRKLIQWLQRLVEPDLSRRYSSASIAFAGLKTGRADIRALPVQLGQPEGSRILLFKTAEAIEIRSPYFSWKDLCTNLMTWWLWPVWAITLLVFFITLWVNWLWLDQLLFMLALVSGLGLITCTVRLLVRMPRLLIRYRQRFRIDTKYIAFWHEIWGIPFARRFAGRQHIRKLVYTKRYYQSTSDGQVPVHPRIQVWTGVQKFELGELLSPPEQDWLVQELSDWLDLPIDRE